MILLKYNFNFRFYTASFSYENGKPIFRRMRKAPFPERGCADKKLDVPAIATNSPKNIFYLYLDILPLDGKLSTNN